VLQELTARVVVCPVSNNTPFVRLEVIVQAALHLQLIVPLGLMNQALEVDMDVKIVKRICMSIFWNE
jgi:hypothetical protein